MNKLFTKEELQKLANPLFKRYGVKTMYGTEDGQIFLLHNRAGLHAGSKLRIHTLEEESPLKVIMDEVFEEVKNVKTLLGELEGKTLEDLTVAMAEELQGPNRKSAVAGIQKLMDAAAEIPAGKVENHGKPKAEDKPKVDEEDEVDEIQKEGEKAEADEKKSSEVPEETKEEVKEEVKVEETPEVKEEVKKPVTKKVVKPKGK